MPNRNARPGPDITPFKGQGLVAEGLLPVPRLEGQFARQDARAFDGLAEQLNTIADKQAAVEGDRAGKIAGQDPNYRPTGATTIRGLSMEKAATSTYVDTLQTQMREQIWKVYQDNANDPAALEAALAKTKDEFAAKNVFPEIKPQFESDWSRATMPYRHQAFRDVQAKTRDAAGAAAVENVTGLDRELERIAAMPAGPERDKLLEDATKRRDETLQRAVDAEAITQTEAAKLRQKGRDTTLRKAVVSEVSRLPKEDQPAALQKIDEARKSGKGPLATMPDAEFDAAKAEVEQAARVDEAQRNRAFNAWNRDATAAARRLEQGLPLTDADLAKLRLGSGMLKDARADVAMQNIDELSSVQSAFRGKTLPDMRKTLTEMEARSKTSGASEADKRKLKLAQGMVSEMEKGLAKDPIGTAEAEGLVKPTPLDVSSPDALAKSIGTRLDVSKAVQQRYEIPTARTFKPEEVSALKAAIAAGGDQALAVAEAVVKGAGRDARRVLQELTGEVPALASIGALVATGQPGSREAARDAARALQLRKEGGQRLTYSGVEDVKREVIGDALIDAQQDDAAVRETARLIFEGRVPPSIDPKSNEADKLIRQSFQAAAGRHTVGGVEYGGVVDYKPGFWKTYKTLVPSNVKADSFRDVVRAIDDTVLDSLPGGRPVDQSGKPIPAKQLHSAIPVRVPGGYRFATDTDEAGRPAKYIPGPGNKPLVIDIDALEPELRRKVPGAFLGGSR